MTTVTNTAAQVTALTENEEEGPVTRRFRKLQKNR